MAVSEARKRAVRKYDAAHYEVQSVKFPKGTKERIKALGGTVSGFAVSATIGALEAAEARARQDACAREETVDTRASNAVTRASKVDDARASKVVNVPCDVWEKLRGYGDPEKIILTAAKNALKLYDMVM